MRLQYRLATGGLIAAALGVAMIAPLQAGDVVTPLEYFEDGRRAVEAYLEPGERAALERAKRSCVRIESRSPRSDGSYRSVMGSGVMLGRGGLVLTAGHTLTRGGGGTIRVIATDGSSYEARVLEQRHGDRDGSGTDWALLELRGAPELATPLPTAAAREGSTGFVLGYPDQIGVDARGRVDYGSRHPDEYLEPLITVGRVRGCEPLTLEPLAGSIPTAGMSGGPVFDDRGVLIGIFVSILHAAHDDATPWLYRVIPVSEALGNRPGGR